jgi:hypothetical protein
MVRRSAALYKGKIIDIASIYTVIDGRQINIPDKVEELRTLARNNELFCECGCGANLTLVAGDKNVRAQHFRIKGTNALNCHLITEGKISIYSKIVLKCWLDDNLHAEDLNLRVPISAVTDSSRKYEFSFISRNAGIAINYCHDRANLSDEKLSILDENSKGIHIIHIVDASNAGTNGQYPEGLMKVQSRQGYCLLLAVENSDYDKAMLSALFYAENLKGLWEEIIFANGMLKEYKISADGDILFRGERLSKLFDIEKQSFAERISNEKKQREEAERWRAEQWKKQQEEAERRDAERRKALQLEAERQKEIQRREALEKKLKEDERNSAIQKRVKALEHNTALKVYNCDKPVYGLDGDRLFMCKKCYKEANIKSFARIFEGTNFGICNQCKDTIS